jgi:uncharacterized protein YkwD
MVLCALVLGTGKPASAAPTKMELRLISKINQVRSAHGLRKLRIGSRLQRGAHSWAVYLLRSDSFYHGRIAAGTSEVIAWGTCSWITPAAVVTMWMRSYSHRVNVLRRGIRYVGAGWASGPWRGYGCVKMAVARFR